MIIKSLGLLFISGMVAFAVLAERGFPTPESAALQSASVRACLGDGYRVVDIATHPHLYAGHLEVERQWGSVVLVLHNPLQRPHTAQSWVLVTCRIKCQAQGERIHYRVDSQDRVEMSARR